MTGLDESFVLGLLAGTVAFSLCAVWLIQEVLQNCRMRYKLDKLYNFLRTENTKLSRDSVCELLRDIRYDGLNVSDFIQHLYQRSDSDKVFNKTRFAGLRSVADMSCSLLARKRDEPQPKDISGKTKVIPFRDNLKKK